MQTLQRMKGNENGFGQMESEETIRAFVNWWNEKSARPFDEDQEISAAPPHNKAA